MASFIENKENIGYLIPEPEEENQQPLVYTYAIFKTPRERQKISPELEAVYARRDLIKKKLDEVIEQYYKNLAAANESETAEVPEVPTKCDPIDSAPDTILAPPDSKLDDISTPPKSDSDTFLDGNVAAVIKGICGIGMFGCLAATVLLHPFGAYFAIPIGFMFCCTLFADDKHVAKFLIPLTVFLFVVSILLAVVFWNNFFMKDESEDAMLAPIYALTIWIYISFCYFVVLCCYYWLQVDPTVDAHGFEDNEWFDT